MNTKLNADELANKRWAYRVDTGLGKAIQDGCKQGYAAAIREHAQPLADERDELVALLYEVEQLYPYTEGFSVLWNKIEAILAKYPKP